MGRPLSNDLLSVSSRLQLAARTAERWRLDLVLRYPGGEVVAALSGDWLTGAREDGTVLDLHRSFIMERISQTPHLESVDQR